MIDICKTQKSATFDCPVNNRRVLYITVSHLQL